MAGRLLNTREAAERLSLNANTLEKRRCLRSWDLPYVKLGGKVLYRESDLDAFIERNTHGGGKKTK